jgi:hypothetical protein
MRLMTDPEIHYLPLTKAEADAYVYAIERVTRIWYSTKKSDRHLRAKNVHAYNAIQKLIGQLKQIAYQGWGPTQKPGPAFDLALMRDNEAEARQLDGAFHDPDGDNGTE